jgi:Big-like domain-containing protein/MBG domain-containing protein/Kelch motif protein/galactose oxidase-like protein
LVTKGIQGANGETGNRNILCRFFCFGVERELRGTPLVGFLEERMEIKGSLSAVDTLRVSKSPNRCFAAAVIVLLAGMFFGALCQAQILGTSQLNTARRGHTATLLQDGKVLVIGGDNLTGIIGQTEIYDPATKNFAAGPSLQTARTDHAAIALPDGRVLVIGGRDQNGPLTSSEIYNPLTGSFISGPSMTTPRSGHTVTTLSNGNILVAGGDAAGSAEIYNPAAQTFSPIAANMMKARKFHSAILTSAGQVLFVGGVDAQNAVLNTAEIYDPASQSFYLPPTDMKSPRAFATLRLLPDGKVQIIGGDSDFSMEIFDPQDGKFNAVAYLPPTPDLLGATLSTRSRAALVSPYASLNPNLLSTTLTPEQLALLDRADHTITELSSQNQALVAGGISSAGQVLNSASLVSSSPASVTTDKTDYAPDTIVTITGKGFQPNEDVAMALHERPDAYPDFAFTAPADNQGNFTFMQFAPQPIDIGRTFTLTAIGQSSGFIAQTAFTDACTVTVVSVGAQSGTLTFGTGGSVTFNVTLTKTNGNCSGNWSITTLLPAGVTASFNPTTFSGSGTSKTTTLTLTSSASTSAGSFSFTVQAGGSDTGGNATGGGTLTIGKANQTITFDALGNKIYGDPDFSVSATASSGLTVSFSSQTTPTCSVSGNNVHIITAGACTIRASQSGNSNYNAAPNVDQSFTINKAPPTINWNNPADMTYGTALSATQLNATASAIVNGSSVSVAGVFTYTPAAGTILNAGNSQTLHVSFAPSDTTNYTSPVTKDVTINVLRKDATWTTNVASKTYGDTDPDPLTTGSGSGFLASDGVTATYSRAAGENASPPTYHITATLSSTVSGALSNYNITNNGAEFTINKRNATWTTNAASKTYGDVDPNPLTTGSGSGFLPSDNVTATYSRAAGEAVAGSPYHITATLSPAGVLSNYVITTAGADFTIIAKAASVTPNASSKTFGDIDPTFTGTLVGFLAADGVTATYSRTAGENVAGSPYIISATLSPASVLSNYNITYNTANFTINKANATCSINGYTGIYDDAAHGATGSCKGIDGITVLAGLNLGGSFTNVPGGTANWSFTDVTGNYNDQSGSVAIVINKADATITVSGYTGVYDGNAHGATGTATGVGGVDLSGLLNFGATFTNVPGGTAHWTFTGGTNYNDASGDVAIVINKADANILVSGYTGVYDGGAHSATGSATGVGGVDLSGSLNLGATFTNVPGGTAHWTFAGGTNYNDASGDVAIVINKANATINVVGYTGIFDGNAHGATGTATGVGGVNLSGSLNLGATFTNVPGGTAHWIFSGGTNYNDANGDVAIVINRADAIITVNGYTGLYDGNAHGATGTAVGLAGANLTGSLNLGATFVDAPGGTAHWVFNGGTNYNNASGDVAIVINQATPIVSVIGGTFTDNAQPHGATGFAYGIGGVGDVLSPTVTFSYAGTGSTTYGPTADAPSTPGTYVATATFPGNLNYTNASNADTIIIKNAAPQVQGQTVATNEDVLLPITLRARDLDSNGLTFTITTGPTNGALDAMSGVLTCTSVPIAPGAMSCTAAVTYTPSPNYNGSDSFKFTVNDGQLDSSEATVTLTVYPVNDAPMANAQSVSTDDFTPLPITLTGSDVETGAANLTFVIVDAPTNGTLSGTPPNVTFTPNFNYKGPDSFTFTVTDRGDPDNCGAPNQTCADAKTSPKTTVSITVTDGTAPQTLITNLKPTSLSNDRNPSFGFSGTDNVTDASSLTFECKLDYDAWMACGTSGNPTTSYSNLTDGSHTFQVRAKDDSGNVDQNPPSYTWIIDATPPDTVIDSQPAATVNSSTATFTYHSNENSTFLCSLDGGAAVDCTTSATQTYTNLADGQHTFSVGAKDDAGNFDPTPAIYAWNVDTTAPQTSIDTQPTNPTTSTSASFTFHGSDAADTFECSLDGASFTACMSPKAYNGLALGNHSFAVRAKDSTGNTDATPTSYSWTIGQVTLDQYTIDSDFKRFDGFDVVFGKGSQNNLKINSTNPDSFHYQIKLTNNTGAPISAANGNVATAIITVPGMSSSCGGVACSSQIGSLADPAFVLKGRKVAHVWPGYHDRDGDDDDDDMPVTVKYMTLAQYQANGNSCADNSNYSSTLPSNGAPKCIKISGFTIPVKHSARIRLNFQFRWKGTDGWNANAQQLFYAGFVFRAATSVNFGSSVQTASDATGIVGAGKKATAIGGYVFSGITPGTGNTVRLFTKKTDASCTVNSKLVAQDVIDANGFYYIWRSGADQHNSNANSLPSGVQYAVQLCDGSTQLGLTSMDSKLREQEFEQVDFNP